MDIRIRVKKVEAGTATQLEAEEIARVKPLYNVAMNGSLYTCLCDPTRKYKNRKDFEKHMYKVHKEELEELTFNNESEDESD